MTEKKQVQEEDETEKARHWHRAREIENVEHWMRCAFREWRTHNNSEILIEDVERLVGTLRFVVQK